MPGAQGPALAGDHHLRRKVLSTQGRPQRAQGTATTPPSAVLYRRSGEKRTLRITAQYADHWNFVGGPPEEFARKRDVLAAHCADIGRDPKEITLSAHIRLGEDHNHRRVIEDAIALGAEGLDLAIIYLPPPYDPAVLEPLAQEIAASGLLNSKG